MRHFVGVFPCSERIIYRKENSVYPSNRKTKNLLTGVLSIILISSFVTPNLASAAGKPSIKVSPAKGLKNNQSIQISGSGFTPKDSLYIVQCLVTAKGQADCNTAGAVPTTVDASGKFTKTAFVVVTGKIGTKTCGTSKADAKNCDISVGNITGGDSTALPISFAIKGKK